MQFENVINTGTLLAVFFQTLTVVAAIVVGWFRIKADIIVIKTDVKGLQNASENFAKALAQLSSVLTQVAVQDNRLLNMEKKLDELAHGKGFIK